MTMNPRSRSGTIILMLAIGAVLFMGILALVIDLIFVYYVHSVLVTTVDAAVLRATRSIGRGASDAEQQAEIERVVALLFAANFPEGHLGAKSGPAFFVIYR